MDFIKKILESATITDGALNIDDLMTQINSELPKHAVPKEMFNQTNNELKQAKKDVATRDEQLEALKNVEGDTTNLKAEIERIKGENKKSVETYEAEIAEIKRSTAIDRALETAKAKIPKAVKALLDLDKIKLDGETLIGMEDQLKTLMEDENSKILFGAEAETQIAGAKPAESGDKEPGSGDLSPGAMYAQQFNAQFAPPTTN